MLVLFSINTLSLIGGNPHKEVKSNIEEVTVFLNGAQVQRSTTANLPEGQTKVIFKKLSPNINMKSLLLSCKEDLQILDVKHKTYQTEQEDNLEDLEASVKEGILQLRNELEDLDLQLTLIREEQVILEQEKRFIKDVKLTHKNGEQEVSALAQQLDFYQEKYISLTKRLFELNKEQQKVSLVKRGKERTLNEVNQQHNVSKKNAIFSQIEVLIKTEKALTANFDLSYLVNDARWIPSYDIRTEGIDKPLEFTYKSEIYQNTGIDWKDVKLTVSTANPYQNNNRPILSPWYLDFYVPRVYAQQTGKNYNRSNMMSNSYAAPRNDIPAEMPQNQDGASMQNNVSVVETDLNLAFELDWKHSILSDGQSHTLVLKEEEVAAEYTYHSVPKLDCKSYLIAKVKDWGRLNLLNGNANLFSEGTYVGQTLINPQLVSEYLLLSLGIDEKMNVKRIKLETGASSSFFGSTKTQTFTYETTLHNNKNKVVKMELLDQVPISNNGEIVVELVKSDGAEYVADIGKLLWNLELQPNEIRKVQFKYSVKYPKDKQLGN